MDAVGEGILKIVLLVLLILGALRVVLIDLKHVIRAIKSLFER